jgi:hypothetical protein
MRRDGDVVGRKDAVAGMNEECGRRGGRGIRNGGAVKGKGGAKKRPSVETEGRLTIACHMKNLERSMLLLLFSGHKDKTRSATE